MLAIDSSSKNTKKILKQIDLQDYFDTISDGTNIKKSKPERVNPCPNCGVDGHEFNAKYCYNCGEAL